MSATATNRMLAAALAYAQHGWHVFPLRPSKYPYGNCPECNPERDTYRAHQPGTCGHDLCHSFYAATTDPATITDWWKRLPDSNLAIRTGRHSGIAAVDIDPRSGGRRSLIRLENDHGLLPGTVMQITGSDGLHLIYQHRDGLGIGAKVWGPGIDLRGEGGYIVAAPSIHPRTGDRYRWSGDGDFRHPLPPWPDRHLPPPVKEPPRPITAAPDPGRAGGGPLAGLVRFVLASGDGTRNDRLNWAAYHAGEHVTKGRFDAGEAVSALLEAARHIGLGEKEAAATIESGLTNGMRAVA
jgi:hypothetical protein